MELVFHWLAMKNCSLTYDVIQAPSFIAVHLFNLNIKLVKSSTELMVIEHRKMQLLCVYQMLLRIVSGRGGGFRSYC